MASITATAKFFRLPCPSLFSFTTCIMDSAMGYIIIVVAVLLSHMLMKPVARMNPSTILSPLVPGARMMTRAMRVCRFHYSLAIPIMKPPRKRKMIESP